MDTSTIKKELDLKSNDELVELLYFDKQNTNYVRLQVVKELISERDINDGQLKVIKRRVKKRRKIAYLERQKSNARFSLAEGFFHVLLFILGGSD